MFEQLFGRPEAAARHRAGPLAEERLAFLTHLARQGMSCWALQKFAFHTLAGAQALRLAERPDEPISAAEVEQQADRWAQRRRRTSQPSNPPRARQRFICHVTQWLQFLGRWQGPSIQPSPAAERLAAFAHYLQHERELSPATIRRYCQTARHFLRELGSAATCLHDVTVPQIDGAFSALVGHGRYARVTVRSLADDVRAFLRYAEVRGWCRTGLAEVIKGPRIFTQQSLPTGPSWDDVRRLLALTEGEDPQAIRDRAILMLLAVYGLRAGEVNRLRLEDFDWDREVLSVHASKTRRTRTYPLTRPVGAAVLRYLKDVRPRSAHRQVFLTLRAPIRPLRQALWAVVAKRLRSLGLALPHYGPHALRHACATHLLARGLSLKEIGDHLGHTDYQQATRIYAKVDLLGLRQVADFDLGGLS
jgi:site-specific recombinase XerD